MTSSITGRPTIAYSCRAVAAIFTAAAWLTLGYGLFGTPVDHAYADELEAGGRFGVNFALYWPFYLLSTAVLAMVVLTLLPRVQSLIPLAITNSVIWVFAISVLSVNEIAYRPDLRVFAPWTVAVVAASFLILGLAWNLQPDPPPRTSSGPA